MVNSWWTSNVSSFVRSLVRYKSIFIVVRTTTVKSAVCWAVDGALTTCPRGGGGACRGRRSRRRRGRTTWSGTTRSSSTRSTACSSRRSSAPSAPRCRWRSTRSATCRCRCPSRRSGTSRCSSSRSMPHSPSPRWRANTAVEILYSCALS